VAAIEVADPTALVRLLPGLLGVVLVGFAVAPLKGAGSRRLLRAGVGFFVVVVVVDALLRATSLNSLLVGAVGALLAWDLGDHAIGLGEQLGRRAETKAVELTHAAASVGVGVAAVLLGRAVAGVGSAGEPLATLVLLLVAAALLVGALYR
jgi:hypothetical protein